MPLDGATFAACLKELIAGSKFVKKVVEAAPAQDFATSFQQEPQIHKHGGTMQINQVAVQLYTLRDFLKTPGDVADSMKKVREIGYQAVQVSGMGPIAEEELVKILDGEGLTLCATHEPISTIFNEPQKVVERLQKLNCKYTAVPYPSRIGLKTAEEVQDYVSRIAQAGAVLAQNDQVLTYHNHHMEFRRVDGKVILETIYDETDPVEVQGELDTYWVQYGGGDVVDWCRRLNNRLPLLHCKDYKINDEDKPIFAEIGQGNLNWKGIIDAADGAGCQWFIVEQDVCPGDPFDSLTMSFEYIRDNLCS
jgi:sugar phosphate isomerase/epimerase